ncbi:MAG TPA: PAS domain-containing sensor histidine kinase [bacterium]
MSKILLLLNHQENRRLLAKVLAERYEVLLPKSDKAIDGIFDLCILDGPALQRLQKRVNGRRESESTFLPFLLVTPRENVGKIHQYLWKTIDELLVSPIDKVELQARVEIGLRTRRLSLDLQKAGEDKYRHIFENAIEGIFQTTQDRRLITANPALARILGYDSPEELIQTITDLQQQLFVDPAKRLEFKQRLQTSGMVKGFEAQFYRKDGNKCWIVVNTVAARGARGAVLYYEGTVEDISDRKMAEAVLRKTRQSILTAQEAERSRIARELHDEVCQRLSAMKLHLGALANSIGQNNKAVLPKLRIIKQQVDLNITEVRRISLHLRPTALDDLGLTKAVRQLCSEFEKDHHVAISLRAMNSLSALCDTAVGIALYRIVQEGLSNISKHAQATRVLVKLSRRQNRLTLDIEDNGKGFILEKLKAPHAAGHQLGLLNMKERSELLGGTFRVESARQKGTRIHVEIPLGSHEAYEEN